MGDTRGSNTAKSTVGIDAGGEAKAPAEARLSPHIRYKRLIKAGHVPMLLTPSGHVVVWLATPAVLFLATVLVETPPLVVIECLRRISDVLSLYFVPSDNGYTKARRYIICDAIRNKAVTIHHLLDEMVDGGLPIMTDETVLRDHISDSTMVKRLISSIKGSPEKSVHEGPEYIPATPWRRKDVKFHTLNELKLDFIEHVYATIQSGTGRVVQSRVEGRIEAVSKLNGVPTISMRLQNIDLIDSVSFHPCVRYCLYEKHREISFLPPDGLFTLMSYSSAGHDSVQLPIEVGCDCEQKKGSQGEPLSAGAVRLMAFVNNSVAGSKMCVEHISLSFILPRTVASHSVKLDMSEGKVSYDQNTGQVIWKVASLSAGLHRDKLPVLNVGFVFQDGVWETGNAFRRKPEVACDFYAPGFSSSGIRYGSLCVETEKYKCKTHYRYSTLAGEVTYRP